MSKLIRINLAGYCYFITKNTNNKLNALTDDRYKDVIIKNLKFYRRKYKYFLNGYVIMPNHFHLLLTVAKEKDISNIMRDLDSYTNKQIQKLAAAQGPRLRGELNRTIWQKRYYDHIIRNEKDFEEKLNYIHNNPVRAGLVDRPEDYKYSSYRNYYLNDDSIIKIDKI